MSQDSKPVRAYVFVCKEIIVHGITGKKRVCGKVIQSFYSGQFEWYKSQHMAKHLSKKEGTTTGQALKKLQAES